MTTKLDKMNMDEITDMTKQIAAVLKLEIILHKLKPN